MTRALTPGTLLCVVALAASGCGDDRSGEPDAGAEAGVDGGPEAAVDAPTDAPLDGARDADAGPRSCADLLATGRTFRPLPDMEDTQVHPAAVFDGEGVWLAFTGPEEGDTGNLDTWAVRLACDGSQMLAPFRVSTVRTPNESDPTLAMSDGRLWVAWISDDGSAPLDGGVPANLDIRHRLFDVDGTPRMDEDVTLETMREGSPVVRNAWFPEAKPRPGGGFVVTGIRALEETGTFQVFAQRMDADAALDGEAVDGFVDGDVTQVAPSVGVASDDSLHLAWAEQASGEDEHAVHRPLDDADATPERIAPSVVSSGEPSLAVDPTDDARRYVAVHAGGGNADIRITDVGRPAAERTQAELGRVDQLDHTPTLRVHPDGGRGAVAWLRVERGTANELFVATFTDDAGTITASDPVPIDSADPPGPYAPALTHVVGETWMVAWAARTSDGFRVFARFVSLE